MNCLGPMNRAPTVWGSVLTFMWALIGEVRRAGEGERCFSPRFIGFACSSCKLW